MNNNAIAELLTDLVQINNDRIEVYEDAARQLQSGYDNLYDLFGRMANESKINQAALVAEIEKLNEPVAEGTSGVGKLNRVWMDIKALVSGGEPRPILKTCETVDAATQNAYDEALDKEKIPIEIRRLIEKQKNGLLESTNQIKELLAIADKSK